MTDLFPLLTLEDFRVCAAEILEEITPHGYGLFWLFRNQSVRGMLGCIRGSLRARGPVCPGVKAVTASDATLLIPAVSRPRAPYALTGALCVEALIVFNDRLPGDWKEDLRRPGPSRSMFSLG